MKRTLAMVLALSVAVAIAAPTLAKKAIHKAEPKHRETVMSEIKGGYAVPNFRLTHRLEGEDQFSILRPCFSPDGRYVAANLNQTKTVRVWDTQSGRMVAEIKPELIYGNMQLVDGMEFTPDSRRLIVFRAGFPLKEIDFQNQEVVRTIELGINGPKIEDYAFTPDYRWLVLATPNGVQIWDYEKGIRKDTYVEGDYVNTVTISNNGRWVAFGRRGDVRRSVGLIDVRSNKIERYPLANLTDEQLDRINNYQVRYVGFENRDNNLLVGYMELPDGQYNASGPAGIFRIDINKNEVVGPKPLSSNMLSFDPIDLGRSYNTTFFNTFDMSNGSGISAADFVSPNLQKIKTIGSAEFDAPMFTYRVSPDRRWMVGSFRESDGKYRARLYEMMPERVTPGNNEETER